MGRVWAIRAGFPMGWASQPGAERKLQLPALRRLLCSQAERAVPWMQLQGESVIGLLKRGRHSAVP